MRTPSWMSPEQSFLAEKVFPMTCSRTLPTANGDSCDSNSLSSYMGMAKNLGTQLLSGQLAPQVPWWERLSLVVTLAQCLLRCQSAYFLGRCCSMCDVHSIQCKGCAANHRAQTTDCACTISRCRHDTLHRADPYHCGDYAKQPSPDLSQGQNSALCPRGASKVLRILQVHSAAKVPFSPDTGMACTVRHRHLLSCGNPTTVRESCCTKH